MKVLTIRVDDSFEQQLKALAEARRVTVSVAVRELLYAGYESQRKASVREPDSPRLHLIVEQNDVQMQIGLQVRQLLRSFMRAANIRDPEQLIKDAETSATESHKAWLTTRQTRR